MATYTEYKTLDLHQSEFNHTSNYRTQYRSFNFFRMSDQLQYFETTNIENHEHYIIFEDKNDHTINLFTGNDEWSKNKYISFHIGMNQFTYQVNNIDNIVFQIKKPLTSDNFFDSNIKQ